jgi:[protein-PII] uridylyltransferase
MATRRDLDDPATVATVADEVGDERLLDLLHALTQADALATGPAAWSSWKKSLIDELVVRTRQELRARAGDIVEVGAVMPVSVPSEDLATDGVVVRVEHDERSCAVTVVAPDQNGLLSTVAGVLALHRLGVRGAQVETLASPSGEPRAVQVWNVLPMFGDPAPASRIREDISRVINGSLDLAERLSAREQDYGAPVGTAEPRVQVVPGASSRATVLEVRAHDAPGLLHRISSAIATVGVSITAARVATLGSEVVDVFYLVSGSGGPLDSAQSNAVVGEVTEVLARGTR